MSRMSKLKFIFFRQAKKENSTFFLEMSGNSSHSHSSRHRLSSTTSGSPPNSHQMSSQASSNSTRTSQSRSRNSYRQPSSLQEQEIGNFTEHKIMFATNFLLTLVPKCSKILTNFKLALLLTAPPFFCPFIGILSRSILIIFYGFFRLYSSYPRWLFYN